MIYFAISIDGSIEQGIKMFEKRTNQKAKYLIVHKNKIDKIKDKTNLEIIPVDWIHELSLGISSEKE